MNEQKFIDQLKRLVAFQTTTDNRVENKKLVDYVETLINKKAIIKRWSNKYSDILFVSNKKTLKPELCYLVHGDVVSGERFQFSLQRKGDRLMGRGASDMKFSIPIGIEIFNRWIANDKKTSLAFVLTTDEEGGGFNGAKNLVEKYGLDPKVLIVPDGGDNFELVYRSKGVAHILVESKGKPAHASEPWMGRSALTPLIKLGSILNDLYGKTNRKANWGITCNIGQLHGGESTNQVCAYAQMKVDFRFPETVTSEDMVKHVRDLVRKNKLSIKASVLVSGEPIFTDVRSDVVKNFLRSFEKTLGREIKSVGDCGSSDARFFSNSNVLMIKPEGGDIHGHKEWISLKSSLIYFEALWNFMVNNYE